jgi:hypothetical protein
MGVSLSDDTKIINQRNSVGILQIKKLNLLNVLLNGFIGPSL